ncbi:MAG: helix-turn-helix transcriptional regulator [Candidatus Doudnabacteria bacterium]|nr:helix-turn-helix transcriptional regulator [Candidatus Doudnabacteria bacterium]
MKTRKNLKQAIDFQSYLKEQLKNPKFKKYYYEYGKQLEIAYQILQLRKQTGMSQSKLAKKLGTTQSNIARIETGQQNFTTATLQKIAEAFDREVRIEFV